MDVLSEQERSEIYAMRERVWTAWFESDIKQLKKLLPREVLAGDPGSEPWASKEEICDRAVAFSQSGAKLVHLEFPINLYQKYGNVVIIYGTYRFDLEMGGERLSFSGRGTEVFVKDGNLWINTSWHLDSGK